MTDKHMTGGGETHQLEFHWADRMTGYVNGPSVRFRLDLQLTDSLIDADANGFFRISEISRGGRSVVSLDMPLNAPQLKELRDRLNELHLGEGDE